MGFWALTGQSSFPNGPFHVTFRGLHENIPWWLRVGAWRSLVAHYNGVVGVEGSNPFAPTKYKKVHTGDMVYTFYRRYKLTLLSGPKGLRAGLSRPFSLQYLWWCSHCSVWSARNICGYLYRAFELNSCRNAGCYACESGLRVTRFDAIFRVINDNPPTSSANVLNLNTWAQICFCSVTRI